MCERGEKEESRVKEQMVRPQARLRLEETDYEKQMWRQRGLGHSAAHTEHSMSMEYKYHVEITDHAAYLFFLPLS